VLSSEVSGLPVILENRYLQVKTGASAGAHRRPHAPAMTEGIMPRPFRAFALLAILMFLVPGAASAWEAPSHWSDVGDVADWKALDTMFYRLRDDPVFLDRSQFGVDQEAAYARTLVLDGQFDPVDLQGWDALPQGDREARTKQARKQLGQVVRFRQRIETQAQQTRQNLPTSWGANVSDVTAVGDCLRKLGTATALDPTNPYAWHLYAFLSSCVGDLDRAGHAMAGAEAALARVPEDQLPDLRREVTLDRAWLSWDQGETDAADQAVEQAAALGANDFEVTLLRGLVAARKGDQEAAITQANQLRQVQVRRFPINYRSSTGLPEINYVDAWAAVPSDFAERWIKALCWIEAGQPDMAAKSFGTYQLADVYPQAHRFWNDAGYIYEVTGRHALAVKAWDQARITTPYAPFFPYKPYAKDVGRLTGRPGALPVSLAFDRFPFAGSLLAYGALLTDRVDEAMGDLTRQQLGADALDVLDLCAKRDRGAAQAYLLKGAVYYRLGDTSSASIEVADALELLDKQRDTPGFQAVMAELAGVHAGEGESGLQGFFGQSGSEQGRWAASRNPDQELADLRAAYDADNSDAKRRDLARFLIRNGQAAEGRDLVQGREDAEDVVLTLEADRALGDSTLAVRLAEGLVRSGKDSWNDAGLWTLVGFVCLDEGHDDLGRRALERALELDPGNQGLKLQLKLMKKSGAG